MHRFWHSQLQSDHPCLGTAEDYADECRQERKFSHICVTVTDPPSPAPSLTRSRRRVNQGGRMRNISIVSGYKIAVKASAVDNNPPVSEAIGDLATVLEFDSKAEAEARANQLSDQSDRGLRVQSAAPQDTSDVDGYLVSYEGPNRRWETIRSEVKQRDDYTCQRCGEVKGRERSDELDVHHITPKSEGGTDDKANLTTWCKDCHQHTHAEKRRNGTLAELKEYVQSRDEAYVLPDAAQSKTDISRAEPKLWKLADRWADLEVMKKGSTPVFYQPSEGASADDFLFTHESWNVDRRYDTDDPFYDATHLSGPIYYDDTAIAKGRLGEPPSRADLFQCPQCEFWYVQDPDKQPNEESLAGDGPVEFMALTVEEQLERHRDYYCPGPRPAQAQST